MKPSKTVYFHSLLIFLTALFLRGLYIYHIFDNPLFEEPTSDAMFYYKAGLQIAGLEGGERDFGKEAFFYPPLYPHLLGCLFFLFGKSFLFPRLMQALIGAICCVQIYWLARKIFCPLTGLIAGFMAAFYWVFLFFNGELLSTTLEIFLNLCLLQLLLRAMERKRAASFLCAGLLLGLSALARPTVLPFGLAFFILLLFRKSCQRRVLLGGLFLLGAAVVISPVTLRNALADGHFTLICSNGAINFFIGNNPNSEETIAIRPFSLWRNLWNLPERELGRYPLSMKERERFWSGRAFSTILSQPFSFLLHKLKMLAIFWHSYEVKRNVDIYFFRDFSWLLWTGVVLSFGSVAPLALVGIFLARKKMGEHMPLLLFLAAHMVSVCLFFVCSRYRLPALPVLLIYAAYTVRWILLKKRAKPLLPHFAAILVLVLLVNIDFFHAKNWDPAENHLFLTEAFLDRGDLEKATEEVKRALEYNPRYPEAFFFWGEILSKEGKNKKAAEKFKEAIRLCPEHAEARSSLGHAYIRTGLFAEAAGEFKEVLKIIPNKAVNHFSLGYALNQLGKYKEAERAMKEALRLEPGYDEALFGLASAYLKQGDFESAASQMERILEIYPQHRGEVMKLIQPLPPADRNKIRLRLQKTSNPK